MKRVTVALLFALVLFAILCVTFGSFGMREWQAIGRVRLEREPLSLNWDSTNSYDPYFLQTHMAIISNLLCTPESRRELERNARVKSSEFKLNVGPFRSTTFVHVHYSGSDSNGVQRVASNACVMVERFYATNQSTILVSYLDTFHVIPEPFWERIFDKLKYVIRH